VHEAVVAHEVGGDPGGGISTLDDRSASADHRCGCSRRRSVVYLLSDKGCTDESEAAAMTESIWGLVPIKRLEKAKQRLAAVLEPHACAEFARIMALDVFAAAARARRLAGVAVITADPVVTHIARRKGFCSFEDKIEGGMCLAVEAGAKALASCGATGVLVLPADVPLATADEIDALLERHGSDRAVTIVAAEADGGSNALACSPTDVIAFQYGPHSFQRHLHAARSAGVSPQVVRSSGLARDIDRPHDLAAFLAHKSSSLSHAFITALAESDQRFMDLFFQPREAGYASIHFE
jgi:2-phospho-L-lactate/phosphoenolpyruvate guanylyltransferase